MYIYTYISRGSGKLNLNCKYLQPTILLCTFIIDASALCIFYTTFQTSMRTEEQHVKFLCRLLKRTTWWSIICLIHIIKLTYIIVKNSLQKGNFCSHKKKLNSSSVNIFSFPKVHSNHQEAIQSEFYSHKKKNEEKKRA